MSATAITHTPLNMSGAAGPYFSNKAPITAPPNIATVEPNRRPNRGFLPPVSEESADRPVNVSVSTVVVKSGTASRRTLALRKPIAIAIRTITE